MLDDHDVVLLIFLIIKATNQIVVNQVFFAAKHHNIAINNR